MNLPEEFKERMKKMLGDEYSDFFRAFSSDEENIAVRINTFKDDKGFIKDKLLLSDCVEWCEDGFYTDKETISGNHPYHIAGVIYFQEPSAMAPVEALDVKMGSKVLDMCAAPGGKTTQIAAKLKNTGLIVSNEIVAKRAKILAENVSRLGFSNVVVTNEEPPAIAGKYKEFFDIVIVDAPCSGEGMFRKEEQAVQCWSVAHTVSCGMRQKNIIESAMKCLAPGGRLLYSTCTFAPQENEEVVEFILRKYPYMELENPQKLSMLRDCGEPFCGAKRIYPHLQRGEGHFIALLRDTRKCEKREEIKKKDKEQKLYREFEAKYLNLSLDGSFAEFGENLYLLPYGIDIDKIKVVNAGLYLGVIKKNRFEPSHNLCLALKKVDFKNLINLDAESTELKKYLAGECILCDKNGWTAVCADGFPIGWGKASGGILKNHFPKFMRR